MAGLPVFSMATWPGCRQGPGLWLRIMRAKGGTDAGAYVHVVRMQQSGYCRSATCCRSALLNCRSPEPGLAPAAVRVLLGCFPPGHLPDMGGTDLRPPPHPRCVSLKVKYVIHENFSQFLKRPSGQSQAYKTWPPPHREPAKQRRRLCLNFSQLKIQRSHTLYAFV